MAGHRLSFYHPLTNERKFITVPKCSKIEMVLEQVLSLLDGSELCNSLHNLAQFDNSGLNSQGGTRSKSCNPLPCNDLDFYFHVNISKTDTNIFCDVKILDNFESLDGQKGGS